MPDVKNFRRQKCNRCYVCSSKFAKIIENTTSLTLYLYADTARTQLIDTIVFPLQWHPEIQRPNHSVQCTRTFTTTAQFTKHYTIPVATTDVTTSTQVPVCSLDAAAPRPCPVQTVATASVAYSGHTQSPLTALRLQGSITFVRNRYTRTHDATFSIICFRRVLLAYSGVTTYSFTNTWPWSRHSSTYAVIGPCNGSGSRSDTQLPPVAPYAFHDAAHAFSLAYPNEAFSVPVTIYEPNTSLTAIDDVLHPTNTIALNGIHPGAYPPNLVISSGYTPPVTFGRLGVASSQSSPPAATGNAGCAAETLTLTSQSQFGQVTTYYATVGDLSVFPPSTSMTSASHGSIALFDYTCSLRFQ